MSRKALGRGLGALMPQIDEVGKIGKEIPVDKITPNPYQPRRVFDEASLTELAESIAVRGVLQPISVREVAGGFELVAGERRLRAAKRAGLKTIPAVIHTLSDQQAMEVALIENLQREDLNPIEEAKAFERLLNEFELTQESVAEVVGKSRSAVANSLRLLTLADEVQHAIGNGDISAGHARALLMFPEEHQALLCRKIITEGLSVRDVERLAQESKGKKKNKTKGSQTLNPLMVDIQERMQGVFGTKVKIQPGSKKGQGKIEVEYYSDDDLQHIIEVVMGDSEV